MFDLVVRNGMVIDGSGLPGRRADVAVRDGKVVVVGRVAGAGEREIDADGRVVAPGIVDVHTHYDPQLTFDPYATSSCFHGVTTVLTGNCGFSVAPLQVDDADWLVQLFARVEGMSPDALEAVAHPAFKSFPGFLRHMRGRLGVNAAFYVGHSALRRCVMGESSQVREATADEIDRMSSLLSEAMVAGAAGFSSSHSPTHLDLADRPVPSRMSSAEELRSLVRTVGEAGRGSVAYLPGSAVGGMDECDEQLLIDLALEAMLPVVIQGLGAKSKVDSPGATWDSAKRFIDEASRRGAAIYSMVNSRPFDRSFTLADGTRFYEGAPGFHRMFTETPTTAERLALVRQGDFRAGAREATDHPNQDPLVGPVLRPPVWDDVYVKTVVSRANQRYVGRSISAVAAERGCHPVDAMLDISSSDQLATEFVWKTESPEWRKRTKAAQDDPHMIIGTSDGGAHLDRDDGAAASSYFLSSWVREWGCYSWEEGIRRLTAQPAAICGFMDRGLLLPGYAADIMVFDPETVGPSRKEFVNDFPNGAGRWTSRPQGVHATIVNGTPIVIDGELQDDAGLPGQVVSPGASST